MADKDKLEQKSNTPVTAEQLKDLALATGISGISGRRLGHFDPSNYDTIPEENRNRVYKDIMHLRTRLGLPEYQPTAA